MKSGMLRGVGTGGMAILLVPGLLAWSAVAQDAAPAAEADAAKPAAVAAEKPPSMTTGLEQVARMYQAGITEEVLVTFIANSTNVYNVGADEIVYLHGLGVSPTVLTALIQHDAAPDIAQRRQSAGAVAPLPRQFVLTQPATNLFPSTAPLPTLEELFNGGGGAAMLPGQTPAPTNAAVPTLTQTVARIAYAYVPVALAGDQAVAAEQPAPAPVYEGDNTVYSDPGLSVAYTAPPYYPSYYYGAPNYYSSWCYSPWSWNWRASWYSCYRPWYYNSYWYSPSYCYSPAWSCSTWYPSYYAPYSSFGFAYNSCGTFGIGISFGGWYGWGGWGSHHDDHHGHHDNHHGHHSDFVNTSRGNNVAATGNGIRGGGGRGMRDEIGKPLGSRALVKDVNMRYEQPFTPEAQNTFVPASRIGSEIAKNAAPTAKSASLATKATAAPRAASAPGTRASPMTTVGVPLIRPVSKPVVSVSQSSRLAGESAKPAVTLDSTPAIRTPTVNARPATETAKQSSVAVVGKPAPGLTRPAPAPSTRTVASPIIITRSGATVPATIPGTRPMPGAPTAVGTAPATRPAAPSNPAGRAPSASPYSIARFDASPAPRTMVTVPGRSTVAPVYSAPSFRPPSAPVARSAPSSAPVARSSPASAPAMRSAPAPMRSAPSAPASRPASTGSGGGGGRGIARN
jgi:hypothetical protein